MFSNSQTQNVRFKEDNFKMLRGCVGRTITMSAITE